MSTRCSISPWSWDDGWTRSFVRRLPAQRPGERASMRCFALLGSGEFEPWSEEVDRWMLARVANRDGAVLILPTASAPEGNGVFDRWADMGLDHFRRLEVPAEVLPVKTRADASRPDLVARLEGA